MPIDTSVYNGLMQPQRSAIDYANEYARNDAMRNQNALMGMQLGQAAQSNAAKTGVRNALMRLGPGATLDQQIATLRAEGTPEALQQADTLDTAMQNRQKTAAQAAKDNAEAGKIGYALQIEKANRAIHDIASLDSPQQATASMQQHLASGDIDQAKFQMLTSTLPQDPAQFGAWQRKMIMGIMDAKDRIAATAPKVEMVNTGGAMVPMNINADAGALAPVGAAVQKTVSPDAALAAQTSRANNSATIAAENARAASTMTKPFEVTGPDGLPMLVQQDRQGNVTPVPGFGPKSGASKPLTNDQANARLFATRMQEADNLLAQYASKGVERPGNLHSAADAVGLGAVTNFTQSPDQQGVEQAQRNFVNAVLRKESGAAISNSEFESARKQYFPQLGDSAQVIAQKAQNRKTAIDGMLAQVPPGQRPGGAPTTPGQHPPDITAILNQYGVK